MSDRHKHGSAIGWMFLVGIPLCIVSWAIVVTADTRTIDANDYGGSIAKYVAAVDRHNDNGDRVELTASVCESACTLYLGVSDVCVAPSALFGFHSPQIATRGLALLPSERVRLVNVMANHYPEPLRQWFLSGPAHQIKPMYLTGKELIAMGFPAC